MSDYIERKAVLDYIDHMPSELTSDGKMMIRRIRLTEYISDSIPAADVAPVRHDESMALAMLAGARAIEQNSRKYFGTTYVHDPFGCSKEITYYEAAKKLREEAEAALKGEQGDV